MKSIGININSEIVQVSEGTTVASALMTQDLCVFKHSVTGEPRGPLCGMGLCQECCVQIDGVPHIRACAVYCREGMKVVT